tara:strand:- start:324 stop:1157 length:834 start_codon:yes stop_codon:yes gene_type:complete
MTLSETKEEIISFVTQQEILKKSKERKEKVSRQFLSIKDQKNSLDMSIKNIERIIKSKKSNIEDFKKITVSLKREEEFNKRALENTEDRSAKEKEVGGIVVDSNYIVFILDTSGSMQAIWERVVKYITYLIEIHPEVDGFKAMNDQGVPLMATNDYLPDTKNFRKGLIKAIENFSGQSNSNPIKGIETALKKIKSGQKTSIYVFGDDMSGHGSKAYDATARKIKELNTNLIGKRKARIHSIGFTNSPASLQEGSRRYANMMRIITQENGGTFIGVDN